MQKHFKCIITLRRRQITEHDNDANCFRDYHRLRVSEVTFILVVKNLIDYIRKKER